MNRSTLSWLCGVIFIGALAVQALAKDIPWNGGFEQASEGRPAGWQLQGAWKLDPSSPHSGRYALRLDAQVSQAWNKALSDNPVAWVYEGDELVLSGFYKSATGSVNIGLDLCDDGGEHVQWADAGEMGPAKDWTRLDGRFSITADQWRLGVRSAKIFAQVRKAGGDVSYDDLRLEVKRKSPEKIVRTKAIQVDPTKQADLLREGFESFGSGIPAEWKVVKSVNETAKIEQDAKPLHEGKGCLRISGVRKGVTLVRAPAPMDPKVGMVVSCWMKCERTDNGRGIIRAVLLDEEGVPTGDCFRDEIGWYCALTERRIEIPWDKIPPDAAQIQITIGVRGECPGTVWFDDLRLLPVGLTVAASSSKPHGLYHQGDPATMLLRMYNGCLGEMTYDLRFVLADFWGKETTLVNRPITLPPRRPVEETVDIRFPSLGYFKATTRLSREGESVSEQGVDMALVTPFSEAVFAQESPFGSHWNGMQPDCVSLMREAYVKWVRTSVGWTWVEREQGKYDWTGADRHLQLFFDNGIHPLVIVDGCPQWNSTYKEGMAKTRWGSSYTAYPPRDHKPWTDFCAAVAARFKGKVKYWEVRNEPNVDVFWQGTPEDYAKLLQAAYVGLHRGNPDCQVIFEAASTDMGFYNAVYKGGGKGYCDILATHNYQPSSPGPPEKSPFLEEYYNMRKFLARQGEEKKPIWDTEFCWMGVPMFNMLGWRCCVGEKNQADYLVRSWTLALSAGVVRMFWFPFYSYTSAEMNETHSGGMVHGDYSIKPVFVAHRTLAERLVGTQYSREIHVGPNARCYVFSKGGEEVAVVWAIEKDQQVSLATQADEVTVFDLMNNRSALAVRRGLVAFTATGSPVYLVSSKRFEEAAGAVSDRLALRVRGVTSPGKFERAIDLTLMNLTQTASKGCLSLAGPVSGEGRSYAFDLPPSASADVAFRFAVGSSLRFRAPWVLAAECDGRRIETPLRIAHPGRALAAPLRGAVAVDGNPSEWAEDGRQSVVEQGNLAAWRFHKVFAGYDKERLYLAIAAPKGSAKAVRLLFDLGNDGRLNAEDGDFACEAGLSPGRNGVVRLDPATQKRGEEIGGIQCCCAEGDDGAVCEIAVPAEMLKGRMAAGSAVGFGVTFEGASWPPGFDGAPATAGEIAFSWRAADGSYPQVYREALPGLEEIHAVATTFPEDMAFQYELFASEKENPSDDLGSGDWKLVSPMKVGSGYQLDAVNVRARRLATRLSNLVSDGGFEALAKTGPVKLRPGQEDLQVWQPDRPYCTTDPHVARSGQASAYIPASGRTIEPRNHWSNWRQILPAKPETEYTLSGCIKVEKMADGKASIGAHSYRAGHGETFSIHSSANADSSVAGWQRLSTTFHTAAGEDRIRLYCDISLNGSAWFDDVHVVEGPLPSDIAEIVSQSVR